MAAYVFFLSGLLIKCRNGSLLITTVQQNKHFSDLYLFICFQNVWVCSASQSCITYMKGESIMLHGQACIRFYFIVGTMGKKLPMQFFCMHIHNFFFF